MDQTPARSLEELLSAHLDGELSQEEEAAVRAALEEREEARAILEDQRALSLALRSTLETMGEEMDFSSFADDVMAKIEAAPFADQAAAREAAEERSSLGARLRAALADRLGPRRAPWLAGAAAMAAAALAVSPFVLGGGEPGRMILEGDPANASVLAMQTPTDHGATLFKTTAGTTIIYLTSRE